MGTSLGTYELNHECTFFRIQNKLQVMSIKQRSLIVLWHPEYPYTIFEYHMNH